jgi:hypothetical protein
LKTNPSHNLIELATAVVVRHCEVPAAKKMQNTTKLIAGHPPKKTEEGKAAGPALGEKILNHGWSSAVLQLQLRTVISILKK